ncbi:MAG: 3'-5' exonuclease [Rubrivivax sp.]|nr:3'-5' exonuclease [Rubrivivax sp.]
MSLRDTFAGRWLPRRATRGAAGAGSDTRWVVLDVESTGLDPKSDRLLAIAAIAVRLIGGRPQVELADSFDAVLQHDAAQPDPQARANILVHGIGVGSMRAGHAPAVVLRAFAAWAGDAPRLGFHVAFDRVLIERCEREHLGAVQPATWIDLEPLAAVTHPEVKARALDEWLTHFRIPCLQRHRAIADTLATAELLLRLWPRLARETGGAAPTAAELSKLAAARRWVS